MPTVTFQPSGISIETIPGENLLRAAMLAGVHINASCGGQGVCAKCRVKISTGKVEGGLSERLSPDDLAAGYRLACKAEVLEDVEVTVPLESQVDSKVLNLQRARTSAGLKKREIGGSWLKEKGLFQSTVQKLPVEMEPPVSGSNHSDLDRLYKALREQHNLHKLDPDFEVVQNLPEVMRRENFTATVTVAKPLQKGGRSAIFQVLPGRRLENYGLAVDIGTTTVYGQLLDLNTGDALGEYAEYNNQISYGDDVISRILYASKGDGLKTLQAKVVANINRIISILADKTGVDPGLINHVVSAGNTTMTQLFLGVNPKYIRLSPFVPAATHYPPVRAVNLGLNLGRHVRVYVYPSVSSYVGGDIVAGVLGSNMYHEDPLTLYIDIGTNGEIVVGNKDWMACAACSAGPAFEGGGVEHGMRAAEGAIEDFSLHPGNCEPMIMTIGMAKPKGICGSGLINIVATFFEMGIIDGRGKYRIDLPTPRIRQGESGMEYVLAWADQTDIGRDIVLTEIDIDNLIRAKGAMFAGYTTLLEGVGLRIDDLDRVIIAGGFGQYLNLDRAVTIGLIPELPREKVTFIGNGSLLGAKMVALSNQMRTQVGEIVNKMTNFELSEVPAYMDYYVAAMFLPHTNQDKFPRVMEQIKIMHEALDETCQGNSKR
ncbi:MAG: ASKHA domain-containing protein [Pseudomonadota bacterium]